MAMPPDSPWSTQLPHQTAKPLDMPCLQLVKRFIFGYQGLYGCLTHKQKEPITTHTLNILQSLGLTGLGDWTSSLAMQGGKKSVTRVRKGLFNGSLWLTALVSTLLGPFLFTFGSCILTNSFSSVNKLALCS